MPTKDRIGATIQLYPSHDSDLIQWLETVSKNQRNAELKRVLRRGLDLPDKQLIAQRAQPDDSAQLANIARILDDMQRQHEADMHALADQLNEQHAAALAALERKVNERVNELALTGTVTPNDEIEVTPRLDESAKDARKQKMKKATW